MDFRVLGPLEVTTSDGTPLPIAQPRLRALLSVLMLRAGRRCSRGMLIETLWAGERPPKDPDTALRMYAYRARMALGPAGKRLVTLPDAHRIDIDPNDGELDLHRFRDFTAGGQRALAAGEAGQAVGLFAEALDCWRDPQLPDIPAAPAIEGDVARLLEQFYAAEAGLADAQLALGNHQQILPDLHDAVARDPLCESSWWRLILALYRTKGRAAALQAYARARATMLTELGVRPGRELQTLLQGVLHDSPDLAVPQPVHLDPGSRPVLPPSAAVLLPAGRS